MSQLRPDSNLSIEQLVHTLAQALDPNSLSRRYKKTPMPRHRLHSPRNVLEISRVGTTEGLVFLGLNVAWLFITYRSTDI